MHNDIPKANPRHIALGGIAIWFIILMVLFFGPRNDMPRHRTVHIPTEFAPADRRAAQKSAMREEDSRALASKEKNLTQLRAENSLFSSTQKAVLHLDAAKRRR